MMGCVCVQLESKEDSSWARGEGVYKLLPEVEEKQRQVSVA